MTRLILKKLLMDDDDYDGCDRGSGGRGGGSCEGSGEGSGGGVGVVVLPLVVEVELESLNILLCVIPCRLTYNNILIFIVFHIPNL